MTEIPRMEECMHIDGLDEKDNLILEQIQKNARMSFKEIGEKAGLSRVAVKNRMKVMEDKGIIQGYYTQISAVQVPESIHFILDVETMPEVYRDILDEIATNKMIRQVYTVTGDCRIHAVGLSPNRRELSRFANSLYENVKGVRRLSCNTVLSTVKDIDGGVEYVRYQEHEHLESRGTQT